MKEVLSQKNKLFLFYTLLAVLLLGVLLLLVTFILLPNQSAPVEEQLPQSTEQLQSAQESLDGEVRQITPQENAVLTPGIPARFYVFFTEDVLPEQITVTVSYTYLYKDADTSKKVPFKLQSLGKQALEIRTLEPIQEGAEYRLQLQNRTSGTSVATTKYTSGVISPTPLPANNTELHRYLPHITESYVLEYKPAMNVYLFRFIYNADNPDTFHDQRERAIEDAKQFIQSRGIDPLSVTIEWQNK